MEVDHSEKKIQMILIISVLLFCVNYGVFGISKINILETITNKIGYGDIIMRFIFIVIGISAIFLITKTKIYLPFLGDTVIPTSILQNRIPDNYNKEITINTKPNTKIIYWAAEQNNEKDIKYPDTAYLDYDNYGITTSDNNGMATLKVRNPQQYKIPSGRILDKHIHCRYVKYPGMLSKIETIKLL